MSPRILKLLLIAAGALVLVWGIFQFRRIPRPTVPFAGSWPKTQSVTLTQGQRLLEFRKQSGEWVVSGAAGGPAWSVDADRWRTFESALANVRLDDVISERPERAAEFEVDAASGTRVTLKDGQGKT